MRPPRPVDVLLLLQLIFLVAPLVSPYWITDGVAPEDLEAARRIGAQAKEEYVKNVAGVQDNMARNSLYLDGLENCNNIDRKWTDTIEMEAFRHGNVPDAIMLENAGMKRFTGLFMTLPVQHMTRIAKAACAKHEKQLTCGAEYEGEQMTRNRVADLMSIGNHRMMFEKECGDPTFVARVYPCLGGQVKKWIAPCEELVSSHAVLRESVNSRIADIYETAVAAVKSMKGEDRSVTVPIFDKAMSQISRLEGSKCGAFKEMRICVLRQLLGHCGPETVRAYNMSASLGYLRTERRERLHLDFQVFHYPVHPNCSGL